MITYTLRHGHHRDTLNEMSCALRTSVLLDTVLDATRDAEMAKNIVATDDDNADDTVLRRIVQPWPMESVIHAIPRWMPSTRPLHFFVIYNVDDQNRRHTQVETHEDVWRYVRDETRAAQQWRVSFYALVPPERNFTPSTLKRSAHGKGVASRTAKALEAALHYGLEWRVACDVVCEREENFMSEVQEVLWRCALTAALGEHLFALTETRPSAGSVPHVTERALAPTERARVCDRVRAQCESRYSNIKV